MYLPQFQEICEKQGWDFKWSDDGESAYNHIDDPSK